MVWFYDIPVRQFSASLAIEIQLVHSRKSFRNAQIADKFLAARFSINCLTINILSPQNLPTRNPLCAF